MLRAWRRRSTLRDSGSRKQWLSTIVRNEAFRNYSRPRPDPTDEVEHLEGRDEDLVTATVDRADLEAAMEHLSERDRVLLAMRYEQDMTHPAIAAHLGVPEGTVKVQLHRARIKLRRAYAA